MAAAATLRFVLGDQLSPNISSLRDVDPARDIVLMAEVTAECTYAPHHPQKIAFILAAMRHFAEALRGAGLRVDYRCLDDPDNRGSFSGELAAAVARHQPARIIVTEPGEWRVAEDMAGWQEAIGIPVEVRGDDRFLASRAWFARWAEGRRQLRMEFFYREMRRRTGLLIDKRGQPEGGRWNFDAENRKRLPPGQRPPPLRATPPDAITQAVLRLVGERFGGHAGALAPFGYAVTRAAAEAAVERFIEARLPHFGDFQDWMETGEDHLFHAVISPYLNVGLLDPLAVCRQAEAAYRAGWAPLNAVEGFIRQIIGWREYVRGIYWRFMPGYGETNFLAADRPLPWFYWSGETDMNCLRQCIGQTLRLAYAHHIQRLMVTGNFALLAGIAPKEVCAWYLAVYADAYEWVELPNTHGMALYADGGLIASKPYAASGKYVDRMSNYCRSCRYRVSETLGRDACPFNFLYWAFLDRHRQRLAGNRRMALILKSLDRLPEDRRAAIRAEAATFLDRLR